MTPEVSFGVSVARLIRHNGGVLILEPWWGGQAIGAIFGYDIAPFICVLNPLGLKDTKETNDLMSAVLDWGFEFYVWKDLADVEQTLKELNATRMEVADAKRK